MEFSYTATCKQQVKYFLKEQGLSKSLLAKVKFQGGKILVNQREENVLYPLEEDDIVTVVIPDEAPHETMLSDPQPLDIVFEDAHLLVVNKPSGVASIPAQYHPNGTMANRVKHYIVSKGYADQVIHIVTRLDRDTTGLMLFAKHGFAHALLDQELRQKRLVKKYQALVSGEVLRLVEHDTLDGPIARDLTSLMKRQVAPDGQQAVTEYWLQKRAAEKALVDIRLHTGRTHQIRVHFSALGCPLLGDDMYGGRLDLGISRQALHCCQLQLRHPFTGEQLCFTQPLPKDMAKIANNL